MPCLSGTVLGQIVITIAKGSASYLRLDRSGETVEDEDGCPEEDLNSLFQAIVTGEYTVPDFVSEDAKELLEVSAHLYEEAILYS